MPKILLEVIRAKRVRPEFINFVIFLLRKTKLCTNNHRGQENRFLMLILTQDPAAGGLILLDMFRAKTGRPMFTIFVVSLSR